MPGSRFRKVKFAFFNNGKIKEDMTDCDMETSMAVGACSLLPKTVGSPALTQNSSLRQNRNHEPEQDNFVMDGYV
jgi:hypothetical protein